MFLAFEYQKRCYKQVVCCGRMTPDAASSPRSLAGASGLLFGAAAAAMGIGALAGWALGSWGVGLLVGAVVGIPLGVGTVYAVYSKRDRA